VSGDVRVNCRRARGHRSLLGLFATGNTSQIVEVGSSSPGKTVTLLTADGAPMTPVTRG
jgi:hypothetical protein